MCFGGGRVGQVKRLRIIRLGERDDLVVVPVADAPPATVALAWPDDRQRLPAREVFLAAARTLRR